jgi:hypothetical protein
VRTLEPRIVTTRVAVVRIEPNRTGDRLTVEIDLGPACREPPPVGPAGCGVSVTG